MFKNSTHATKWLFTPEKLREMRAEVNAKAGLPDEDAMDVDGASKSVEKPTPDEIQILLSIYTNNIVEICRRLNVMPRVKATALTYFKRFFLLHSPLEYDPGLVAVTCIFLACKTEEDRRDSKTFAKIIAGLSASSITQMEMVVLEGLKFELHVYHPFRPLRGFLEDFAQKHPMNEAVYKALSQAANDIIHHGLRSDAVLIFPPSQIALTALYLAVQQNNDVDKEAFERYIQSILASINESTELLKTIEPYLTAPVPPKEEQKLVNDKVNAYKNHVKFVLSTRQAPAVAEKVIEDPPAC